MKSVDNCCNGTKLQWWKFLTKPLGVSSITSYWVGSLSRNSFRQSWKLYVAGRHPNKHPNNSWRGCSCLRLAYSSVALSQAVPHGFICCHTLFIPHIVCLYHILFWSPSTKKQGRSYVVEYIYIYIRCKLFEVKTYNRTNVISNNHASECEIKWWNMR